MFLHKNRIKFCLSVQILICKRDAVGLCPTPRSLLKKGDENFSRMGLLKLHVILSRESYTRRKESELSLSAARLAA